MNDNKVTYRYTRIRNGAREFTGETVDLSCADWIAKLLESAAWMFDEDVRALVEKQKTIDGLTYFIDNMDGLPCTLRHFCHVNGVKLDVEDFGINGDDGDGYYDEDDEDDDPRGCANHIFERRRNPEGSVLAKYGVSLGEYYMICDELEDVLYVGSCGLCI